MAIKLSQALEKIVGDLRANGKPWQHEYAGDTVALLAEAVNTKGKIGKIIIEQALGRERICYGPTAVLVAMSQGEIRTDETRLFQNDLPDLALTTAQKILENSRMPGLDKLRKTHPNLYLLQELEKDLQIGANLIRTQANYGTETARNQAPLQAIGQRLNGYTANLMEYDREGEYVSNQAIVDILAVTGEVWKIRGC